MRRIVFRLLLCIQQAKPPGLDLAVRINSCLVFSLWRLRGISSVCLETRVESGGLSYRIRRLEPHDVDELTLFFSREISAEEQRLIPHWVARHSLKGLLGSRGVLLLGAHPGGEQTTSICAYGLCRPTLMGRALVAIAVSPRSRNRGLGTAILRSILAWATQVEQTPLSIVYETNKASLGVIKAAGMSVDRLDDDLWMVNYRPADDA